MNVCKKFRKNRSRWRRQYAMLERKSAEAERRQQWDAVERIHEALVCMEQPAGFKPCCNCKRRGCPAHFDGFVSWDPMNENLHQVRI